MPKWTSMTLATMAIIAFVAPAVALPANAPVRVIFDTDMWDDIDDVLALAMLHAFEYRGEVDILAVTSSTSDKWCASYIDLLNTFYRHPEIPVGLVRNGVTGHPEWLGPARDEPNYTQAISE